MATHEVTWSSFLREPTSVERWLERGDVVLRRREGEPLRLTRVSADEAQHQALVAAVRLLSADAGRQRKLLDAQRVSERLPWTRFLPDDDRRAFVDDFLKTLEACADLGDFAALGNLVIEWKATARLHAEGTAPRLRGAIDPIDKDVRRP